ncbi:MAG: hypothetical protein J7484_02335 [Microbacterium sp.]|nr:hypothetical protein [Microbacterium sp.]
MTNGISRRDALRVGAGVVLGGMAGGLLSSAAQAVPLEVSPMNPPRSATQTFGMIRSGDARHHYVAVKRRVQPETRTIANPLVSGNRWTTSFHVFLVDWQALDSTEILVPVSMGAPQEVVDRAYLYADTLSLIPRELRRLVKTINVIPGEHNITGGGGNINIFTGAKYPLANYPNMFVHEAAHTYNNEMRKDSAALARWRAAVDADRRAGGPLGGFISGYAAEHPDSEDFGESLNAWIAVRFHQDRLNAVDPRYAPFIRSQIPNRIAFFRSLDMDLRPLQI